MKVIIKITREIPNRVIVLDNVVVIEHESVKRVFSEVKPNDN